MLAAPEYNLTRRSHWVRSPSGAGPAEFTDNADVHMINNEFLGGR